MTPTLALDCQLRVEGKLLRRRRRQSRHANLDELFSTVAIGFSAGDDRCDQDFNPSDAVKALCVQQGIAQNAIDTFDQINVGFGVRSGGNPDLEEEQAKIKEELEKIDELLKQLEQARENAQIAVIDMEALAEGMRLGEGLGD